MFGHALSLRFLAIQVTVINESIDYNLLIRQILIAEQPNNCGPVRRTEKELSPSDSPFAIRTLDDSLRDFSRRMDLSDLQRRAIQSSTSEAGQEIAISPQGCYSASLDLSNLRGAAERGMSQDPRNRYLRGLQALGIIGGGLVGAAGLGPVLPRAVAAFTGAFIPANEKLFPDYTIAQLNRLNDSAFASNTVVPKGQGKVVVLFVPLSTLIPLSEFENFRKDPLPYFVGTAATPGLNSLDIILDYSHILALDEITPLVTNIVLPDSEARNLLESKDASGYILGRFLDGADVAVASSSNDKAKIERDTSRASSDERLYFKLHPSAAIAPKTQIDIDVTRGKLKRTFPLVLDAIPVQVSLFTIEADGGQPFKSNGDVKATFTGEGFYNLNPTITARPAATESGEITAGNISLTSTNKLNATLHFKNAKPGAWTLTVSINGSTSSPVTIKVVE